MDYTLMEDFCDFLIERITRSLHVPFFKFLFIRRRFVDIRRESTTRSVATPVHPRTEAEKSSERCWNKLSLSSRPDGYIAVSLLFLYTLRLSLFVGGAGAMGYVDIVSVISLKAGSRERERLHPPIILGLAGT